MAQRIPRISLEQWAILQAVEDEGSYARAAEALSRSQSSISYALKGMQEQLPVELLAMQGRKATLTPAGKTLLRQARVLIDDALSLEHQASNLAEGWETEIRLAVEAIFPTALLSQALAAFVPESRASRVQLIESVLSGTQEALLNGEADLVITHRPPPGFLGQPLLDVTLLAVAHPEHPLHQLKRELSNHDLRAHRQFVVRDSGLKRRQDAGWLDAEQRWTVSQLKTSIQFARDGLGFAWLPYEHIREELEAGTLKRLPLTEGGQRQERLFLVYANRNAAGPATQALAHSLQAICR
ncbi:MAG: LysR family transcriptional regulator [Halomonas sp.]|nr:LysR family transcriptional regulator [Halomonas sp.]MDN6298451.1 LysR family transcriptional regulator [Halomonas sp.]MDN6315624.1 LysR family transcriptional regulator [Halomonas sp.]MDN6336876.1 LysR family transcriptional regulator [Halomonas sp.]